MQNTHKFAAGNIVEQDYSPKGRQWLILNINQSNRYTAKVIKLGPVGDYRKEGEICNDVCLDQCCHLFKRVRKSRKTYLKEAGEFVKIYRTKGQQAGRDYLDQFKGHIAAKIGMAIAVSLIGNK